MNKKYPLPPYNHTPKTQQRATSHEIKPFLNNPITPTIEEWEWITSDEPEISFYRDQIRKHGKLNEEI